MDLSVIREQLAVLSVAEGFYQSSVLFALLRLNIFERLGESYKTVQQLAVELEARPETLARLLNAGVVLNLLASHDGVSFRVSPACRTVLLPSAGDGYLGDWLRLQDDFRLALSHLDEAVLTSKPTITPSTYLGADPDRIRQYIMAMHNYAALRGQGLSHFLDTTACNTMLDLGCGPGTYAFHLGMQNPGLQLYLLDLPEVLEITKDIQTRYPLQNAVGYLPLDVINDDVPGSYDLILASNMLYIFDAHVRRDLMQRLYQALNDNGSLVIHSPYIQADRLGGRWAVYMDLNLLCTTESGKNHTVEETRHWFEDAGFVDIEYCAMSVYGTNGFLRGYKR